MIAALILASVLTVQPGQDFWVATEADARIVSAINVGAAFVPEGKDYTLAATYTVYRLGAEATASGSLAYTNEAVAFRCEDGTYFVRHSSTSSGAHDPIRAGDPDGAFVSVATDPRRQKQAEAVCRPRSGRREGFADLYAWLRGQGVMPTGEATPPLPGPRPYPVTAEQRVRERQRADAAANTGSAPRIGVEASGRNNPGGALVIGYSQTPGGRWITEVYSMPPADPQTARPILFVRRALDSYEAQEQIGWADSRTCAGLIEVLLTANDLPLPVLILPLDESSRIRSRAVGYPAPPPPDGPGAHVFWAPTRGIVADSLQFSTFGGPWVDWVEAVDRVLEPCWRDERPIHTSPVD